MKHSRISHDPLRRAGNIKKTTVSSGILSYQWQFPISYTHTHTQAHSHTHTLPSSLDSLSIYVTLFCPSLPQLTVLISLDELQICRSQLYLRHKAISQTRRLSSSNAPDAMCATANWHKELHVLSSLILTPMASHIVYWKVCQSN